MGNFDLVKFWNDVHESKDTVDDFDIANDVFVSRWGIKNEEDGTIKKVDLRINVRSLVALLIVDDFVSIHGVYNLLFVESYNALVEAVKNTFILQKGK